MIVDATEATQLGCKPCWGAEGVPFRLSSQELLCLAVRSTVGLSNLPVPRWISLRASARLALNPWDPASWAWAPCTLVGVAGTVARKHIRNKIKGGGAQE